MGKNMKKTILAQFFDVGQQKGLFSRTVGKKPLRNTKIAVPLHRQKETTSLATQDNTFI